MKEYLVTGATGRQGGAVARALAQRGHRVRSMTRDPQSPKARPLYELGEVVWGDHDRPASVQRAADGVEGVFLMATPERGPEAETRQALAALEAIAEAGVGHVVYSSVAGADRSTGIPAFESKARVEEHLADMDLDWTVVAPVWFRENLHEPAMAKELAQGRLPLPLPPDRPVQNIEVAEVGRFAAMVLADPKPFQGHRIEIASDENAPEGMAKALSAAGAPVRFVSTPLDEVEDPGSARLYAWLAKEGFSVDVRGLRAGYPELGWRRFAQWAAVTAQVLPPA